MKSRVHHTLTPVANRYQEHPSFPEEPLRSAHFLVHATKQMAIAAARSEMRLFRPASGAAVVLWEAENVLLERLSGSPAGSYGDCRTTQVCHSVYHSFSVTGPNWVSGTVG